MSTPFRAGNLIDGLPANSRDEIVSVLLKQGTTEIERIVSFGQATPEGEWYDQDWHEWVVVIEGSAVLRFEDDSVVEMKKGSYMDLPAHCRHRVEHTSTEPPCVWLAIHFGR